MANAHIEHTLSNGEVWTVQQVVTATGIHKSTVYHRMNKSDDKEFIFQKPTVQGGRLRKAEAYKANRARMWIDKPTKVYFGMPLNPSYLDGKDDRHRDGTKLGFVEQVNLMFYREYNRDCWRRDSKIIKGEVE
jgi:predicted DNA-binding transcriptional regulator AlpA